MEGAAVACNERVHGDGVAARIRTSEGRARAAAAAHVNSGAMGNAQAVGAQSARKRHKRTSRSTPRPSPMAANRRGARAHNMWVRGAGAAPARLAQSPNDVFKDVKPMHVGDYQRKRGGHAAMHISTAHNISARPQPHNTQRGAREPT